MPPSFLCVSDSGEQHTELTRRPERNAEKGNLVLLVLPPPRQAGHGRVGETAPSCLPPSQPRTRTTPTGLSVPWFAGLDMVDCKCELQMRHNVVS